MVEEFICKEFAWAVDGGGEVIDEEEEENWAYHGSLCDLRDHVTGAGGFSIYYHSLCPMVQE